MKRRIIFVPALLIVFSCLSPLAVSQAAAEPSPGRSKVLSAARELMTRARYCALITVGDDGTPQARVVDPFPPEENLTVWIATSSVTRKVRQIERDSRVTLYYFDPEDPGYVTLIGTGALVTDPAEKERHWKDEWSGFYRDKNHGDDYVLIRFTPRRLEVVSYRHELLNDPETWLPLTLEVP